MKAIGKFSDERLDDFCAYCGEHPDTRDHVPSKIILDKPFPENLPVVPACQSCNQSFSLDEEYFGCVLECIINGTTEPSKLKRSKISKILTRKEKLKNRLENSKIIENGNTFFQIEEPDILWFQPIQDMSEYEKVEFYSLTEQTKLPEVGSRALAVLFLGETPMSKWVEVQLNNYQYSVSYYDNMFIVKIIIWEYLACQIEWHE